MLLQRSFLLAALIGFAAAPTGAVETRARLKAEAGSPLGDAYRKAKDPDERFWIVEALRRRLEEREEDAIEVLLIAVRDPQADVRRRALAALKEFTLLAPEARARWQERVQQAASHGAKDDALRVRDSAEALQKALSHPGIAPPRPPAAKPAVLGGRRRAALGAAFWAVCVQLAAFIWLRLALSLLRQCGPPGALGLDWLSRVINRNDFLIFPCVSSIVLFALVGLGGALVLSLCVQPGAPQVPVHWPFVFYILGGFSALVPALLLARRAGRGTPSSGIIRAAFGSLRDLPAAFGLGLLALVLWPFGLVLRRRADRPAGLLLWMATSGAPFAAFRLAAASAGSATWAEAVTKARQAAPAEGEASWFERPLGQPPLLLLFFSAPFLYAVSTVPTEWMGSYPTRLLEIWFVSDVGFGWMFGLWAGAITTAIFLTYWFAASAAYAASLGTRESA